MYDLRRARFAPALALALGAPFGAVAQSTSSDLDALRQEIKAMRADYEDRLQALEQRLKAAESRATSAGSGAPPAPTAAADANASAASAAASGTPGAAAPTAIAPTPTAPGGGAAASFNPSVSLILSGGYTRTSQDPEMYRITGFALPPGAEIGPGTQGFSLSETELTLAASIDPWWRGSASFAVASDNSLSVEEAYVQTTALGHGLSLKAGRFFSNLGYLNPRHAHTWDFVDAPLAYQAMLGTQYGDDGLQLNWIAPIDQYVELGMEVGRGRTFPGSDTNRNGLGSAALTLHTGGDIGESNSWRAGVSVLNAKATDQNLVGVNAAGEPVDQVFSGSTRVWVLDAVWKWAPGGNATRTNFQLQGEYLQSTRSGSLLYDIASANLFGDFRARQSGWYLQGVYQFMPRWRVGLRTERLDPGTPDFLAAAGLFSTYRPLKNSVMLDFNPSEFSRIRLQFAQDQAREGRIDNQIFLQYQMSLGAHGAHSY